VAVSGKVICEPWFELKEGDLLEVNGRALKLQGNTYLIFNKPSGVTATLEDKFARKKIIDFIPRTLGRIYPVGRLDKDSRGLMILTNDGELCYKLTHPKFEIEKEYIIWVKGTISSVAVNKSKKGVKDKGDVLKVKSASINVIKGNKTQIRIVVCEGKKRHLRRLFNRLGFPVVDVKRIRIGNLKLGDLKEGAFRIVDKKTLYKVTLA